MFSKTVEYALRAMVHLAELEREQAPAQTVGEVAARTGVPPHYLSKVLQNLGRAGLITSQRGNGGGFRLSRDAGEISVYDVVQSVDVIERILTCPLGLAAHGTNLCPLHRKLDDAMLALETSFRQTSLLDLLGQDAFALCDIRKS